MIIALVALSVLSVLMAIFIVMGLRKVQRLQKIVDYIECTRITELYDHIEKEIMSTSYTGSLRFELEEGSKSLYNNIQNDLSNIRLDIIKDVDRRHEKIYKKLYDMIDSYDKLEKKNKEYCEYLAEKIREVSKHIEIKSAN